MNLYEYQAKELFRHYGIPIPAGEVVETPGQAKEVAQNLNSKGVAIKAQVLVGGRGKAGGIKVAFSPSEVEQKAEEILGMKIKGMAVKKVLVEEALQIVKELYLGVTIDRSKRQMVILLSDSGGIDIEEIALTEPEKIIKLNINPYLGIMQYHWFKIFSHLITQPEVKRPLINIIKALVCLFQDKDAILAEINPLVLTKEGKLIAADAKIVIDDNSLFRQKEVAKYQELVEEDLLELKAKQKGIPYVHLNGNIGIIGNGAGLVMTTLDLVAREGGSPANFLDVGGGASADKVKEAVELVCEDKKVLALFFNIFGGITRCDEVARGIVEAFRKLDLKMPAVIRLAGTREEEGRQILEAAGLMVEREMELAARKVVNIARERVGG